MRKYKKQSDKKSKMPQAGIIQLEAFLIIDYNNYFFYTNAFLLNKKID